MTDEEFLQSVTCSVVDPQLEKDAAAAMTGLCASNIKDRKRLIAVAYNYGKWVGNKDKEGFGTRPFGLFDMFVRKLMGQ